MYKQITHSAPAYNRHRVHGISQSMASNRRPSTREKVGSVLIDLGERLTQNTVASQPVSRAA